MNIEQKTLNNLMKPSGKKSRKEKRVKKNLFGMKLWSWAEKWTVASLKGDDFSSEKMKKGKKTPLYIPKETL